MLKYKVIKSGKKGCGKKHPVRDASLGRMSNITLSCIPLGMHPYGMQKRLLQKNLPSDASLRDAKRCISLWSYTNHKGAKNTKEIENDLMNYKSLRNGAERDKK